MCQHCAQNGPTMIAGVHLSTYLEAESNKTPWTLNLCPDLEAKLMMTLSRRLRGDSMVFLDPNKISQDMLVDQLVKDIGLSFEYTKELHQVVFRGLSAQAKGILSDIIAWEAIFEVENGKDVNLYQWRVGFIYNDVTTVENAKKYIMGKRTEEARIHQRRMSLAQSPEPPLAIATNFAPPQYTIQSRNPAAALQQLTINTQMSQGFVEGLDSISASYSSFDFDPAPGTAANPISLDADQEGAPSQYTHAHAPRVSSPLATVPPYTAADLVAQPPSILPRAETGFYNPAADADQSTAATRPRSRRRRGRANAS
ncbi:hypothetical protein N0V84_000538 [Fusarium piperis]|uniref:Uncharacterized protein n=1 Tax=Fusarium piperis TaxID=1435070 RepID=A0A9W8WMN4_9HYPO|nr:hypothetical protein N0V84_000538 [Fusarium piperis]